jgi:hypothetical protein
MDKIARGPEAEILIGTAAQITGDYSWLGSRWSVAPEMAVADLNAAGGVHVPAQLE